MATPSQASAVKSLNKSGGRRRFTFKTFSQRLEEVDIHVFQSLDPLKPEPSDGSSFFRDCLVEWRELNTAEDFISFYEIMLPKIQTLPLVILHKDFILSELISRVTMKARLSLEPILRLIAALSRDLMEDFLPFLPRVADSLLCLLESGADGEPEIIEQVFTSWSYVVMHLQKYLGQDIVNILEVSVKLRYYHKDYVQEFMAEAVSFLLRNAPLEQLKKGIRRLMFEVVRKPLPARKFGASALLHYTMRGASLRLHSRAQVAFKLLINTSVFAIGDKFPHGSDTIIEVVGTTFIRLCEEFEPNDLNLMWDWLHEEITYYVTHGCLLHTSRLLSLLISTLQVNKGRKTSDYPKTCELVQLLMKTYITSFGLVEAEHISEIVEKVLQLMLCILDGLHSTNNMSTISGIASQWTPVFKLENKSLLSFIRELLLRDPCILYTFRVNVLSVLNDSIETSPEEVLCLILAFCERLQIRNFRLLDGISEDRISRLCSFLQRATSSHVLSLNAIVLGDHSSTQFDETKLVLLWGVISCYSFMSDTQENCSLLMDMMDVLDRLIMASNDNIAGHPRLVWQSLVGAALSSYHKLTRGEKLGSEDTSKFLDLAKRYKSSVQVLVSVANILDSSDMPMSEENTGCKMFHPELTAQKVVEAMEIFAENLSHSNKDIRLSTLRILCHYESLSCESCTEAEPAGRKMETDVLEKSPIDIQSSNVLKFLRLIEATPLSISSSRKVTLLLTQIHTILASGRMSEAYVTFVLNGIIGILHNRFSYLWDPALECLSMLLSEHTQVVWDKFVSFVERCQFKFLTAHDESNIVENKSDMLSGLDYRFNQFAYRAYDSTPCATVLSLLLQSLQKIPNVIDSRSRQIIPLFFGFLGYNDNNLVSVGSFKSHSCKGKEWKGVLKEWLNLLKVMRNLKCAFCSQFLKDVLQNRLLDDNDAGIQMKVLDCLLIWRDGFLLPYDQHLKNLITSKNLREELARWSLSKESNLIEECHRTHLVPLVIRLLTPKVRKLKTLASQKQASVHHRKAVLGFIAQLDVDELPLFFALLIKPLQVTSETSEEVNFFLSSPGNSRDDSQLISFLNYFSVENIMALSWKRRSAFMHVIEDVLGVFDELRVRPFLDLLMGCVVRVLGSCTLNLQSVKSDGCFPLQNDPSANLTEFINGDSSGSHAMTNTVKKQFKDLRSLCLKIISLVLNKYEDYDFSCEFLDLFIMYVRPLIQSFKQEASSSEKPSSLFSCFVAMSRSHKLVSLLCKEGSLVPDIFSILTVTTASEAIVSCVLKFIENLLILDTELDDDKHAIKRSLVINLESLICGLHVHFVRNTTKRKLIKFSGETALRIFRLLSKYLKEAVLVRQYVEILLRLLTLETHNSDAFVEILQVIQDVVPVLRGEVTDKILSAVYPLLVSAELDVRLSVCALLDSLAQTDPAVLSVAKLFHELNASSSMEIGELDYDTVLNAYEKISIEFFNNLPQEHALVILSQFVYDLSSDELILRQSALRSLLSFVEFSALVLGRELRVDKEMPDVTKNSVDDGWSGNCILRIINKFLLKHMREEMNRGSSVRKEWIELLREMVLKLPGAPDLNSFQALCSKDAEADFFNNIMHLQKHRRAKALSLFKSVVGVSNFSEAIMNKVFIPLFWNMMLDTQDGKGEHVRSACLEALASISGRMKWTSYYALLIRCLKEMTLKPDKQKLLVRLVCSILDQFHFSPICSNQETNQIVSPSALCEFDNSVEFLEVQKCLHKSVLPKIQKLLTSESEKVNVNVSLAALKVLKLLPGDILESQLASIIHRISNFLKNRLESIRDEARSALAACLRELGLEYLQFVVSILRATLKRGYQVHILGYTLNFILSSVVRSSGWKLDYCLEDLLSVAENDIFGDVAEEKEVDKIASKMKETRKNKSFETLKLISQNITFKSCGLKLLSPVTAHLKKHLTPKLKLKLQTVLNSIASGIEGNPSVDLTDLFVFIYGLIEDGIGKESHLRDHSSSIDPQNCGSNPYNRRSFLAIITGAESQCSHLVTDFALGLLHNRIKNMKLDKNNQHLLSMLDPFIKLLGNCLSSKYEDILSSAIRCLTPLIRLPLPAVESQANKIKATVLDIAQCSTNTSSPLFQSCLKLLTVLLQSARVTLSNDQLHLLIQFPLFVDLEKNPSSVALALLKAIVNRKLVAHEIYDLVTRVGELMVTSQVEPIRKKCREILLQFLLDYRLSGKRLQQHLDFLLVNLRYEHSTGREAVLELLNNIVKKFPESLVNEQSQTFFVHLVVCLANDHDSDIRTMTSKVIKRLIGRMSQHSLQSVLEYSLSWYLGSKQQLWGTGAQALGLLAEVMDKGFQKYIPRLLSGTRNILQLTINSFKDKQLDPSDEAMVPFWKEAYYSLVLFEKMLNQFGELCFENDIEDIWEAVVEHLLHPHMWLRRISNRLVAFYFCAVAKACKRSHETFILTRPSRLFETAASMCCQLMTQVDDAAASSIIYNIVFTVCGLHSLTVRNECFDARTFWSTLEQQDHDRFLRAFQLLDPRKGSEIFTSLTSGVYKDNDQETSEDRRSFLVSYLIKRMGKIALVKEAIQMKIIFNSFKKIISQFGKGGYEHYTIEMLLPVYKVCEGFSGKVIADDVKQLAEEVRADIQNRLGTQKYLQQLNRIGKNLKAKRDKRKHGVKLMAVTNPARDAKRKRRIADKHRAHKKRKMMTMKMGVWRR